MKDSEEITDELLKHLSPIHAKHLINENKTLELYKSKYDELDLNSFNFEIAPVIKIRTDCGDYLQIWDVTKRGEAFFVLHPDSNSEQQIILPNYEIGFHNVLYSHGLGSPSVINPYIEDIATGEKVFASSIEIFETNPENLVVSVNSQDIPWNGVLTTGNIIPIGNNYMFKAKFNFFPPIIEQTGMTISEAWLIIDFKVK